MPQFAGTGRQAIGEMRRIVGALRTDGDDTDHHRLAPGLGDLDNLLDQVRGAGLPVRLVVEGRPRPLPPGAQLAVLRVWLSGACPRHHAAGPPERRGARSRVSAGATAQGRDGTVQGRVVGPAAGILTGHEDGFTGIGQRLGALDHSRGTAQVRYAARPSRR
jgi:hypothetical protein